MHVTHEEEEPGPKQPTLQQLSSKIYCKHEDPSRPVSESLSSQAGSLKAPSFECWQTIPSTSDIAGDAAVGTLLSLFALRHSFSQ